MTPPPIWTFPTYRGQPYTPAPVPLLSDDEWVALGYLTDFARWQAKIAEAAVRRKAGL